MNQRKKNHFASKWFNENISMIESTICILDFSKNLRLHFKLKKNPRRTIRSGDYPFENQKLDLPNLLI